MQQIYSAIVPIFLLIILGFIVQKLSNKQHPVLTALDKLGVYTQNNWSHRLNEYVLYLALPALIINSITNTTIKFVDAVYPLMFTIGSSIAYLAFIYLIARFMYPRDEKSMKTLVLCGFFGNVAYIGYPFILNILPDSAPLISLVVGVHILIVFTAVLYILQHHKSYEKQSNITSTIIELIKQPIIIAIVASTVITQYNISLPDQISRTIQYLGNSASPVVLVALGAFIASQRISIGDKKLFSTIIFSKLMLFPLFSIGISLLVSQKIGISVPIIESGMPVAITAFALSDKYELHKDIVAASIVVSTIIAIISLPLLSLLLI